MARKICRRNCVENTWIEILRNDQGILNLTMKIYSQNEVYNDEQIRKSEKTKFRIKRKSGFLQNSSLFQVETIAKLLSSFHDSCP